jgi:hypothetical protein
MTAAFSEVSVSYPCKSMARTKNCERINYFLSKIEVKKYGRIK